MFALGWIAAGCGPAKPPERIVLIVVDTLRRDHLSVYGSESETPNVERLARAGTVYEHAISSFHMTTMSMGALFTGRTPSLESGTAERPVVWNPQNWCGLARFAAPDAQGCIPTSLRTLGESMRDQGYWTLGVASNPFTQAPAGFERGFDAWVELKSGTQRRRRAATPEYRKEVVRSRSGETVTAAAIEALSRRPSDRFFLYVHYMDAHDWVLAGESYEEMVGRMDRALGGLLDYLESEGLMEGAVIVFTADHGEALDEQHWIRATPQHLGNPSFEQLLEIPLIVVGATLERADEPMRGEDVFRFLLHVAGVDAVSESGLEPGELFLSERVWRVYREGGWKSYWHRTTDEFHLVRLETDPAERHDVASSHPDVAAAHRRRIAELSEAMAAPNATTRPIPPFFIELLRSLGYVE